MLLVGLAQSFIISMQTQQYMNIWAIQRNATMDGQDVSCLVATSFLEYANIDLGIAYYHHLASYFGSAIK